VHGIAVEDAGKARRDHGAHAVLPDGERCVLPRATAAEIPPRDDDVTGPDRLHEVGPRLDEAAAAQRVAVGGHVVAAGHDRVGADAVAELEHTRHQTSLAGSVIAPHSAEAAATAGEAR